MVFCDLNGMPMDCMPHKATVTRDGYVGPSRKAVREGDKRCSASSQQCPCTEVTKSNHCHKGWWLSLIKPTTVLTIPDLQ
jgi:hypothetical protein